MPKLLLVESDTPEIVSQIRACGKSTSAACYERTLRSISNKIRVEIAMPYANTFKLASIDFPAYAGIVFTGANVSWCVDEPQALPLRRAMEAAFKAEKPVFGSCNGMQLAAVVLGGECSAAPNGVEAGLALDIKLNKFGVSHPMHQGRAESFAALSIHRDHVSTLPKGAVVTAGNVHSPIQAMVYEQGNVCFWGTQYHPEYTLNDIIDSISDKQGLFYCKAAKATALRAAMQNSGGKAARQLGVYGDDLQSQSIQTELANWVKSLV